MYVPRFLLFLVKNKGNDMETTTSICKAAIGKLKFARSSIFGYILSSAIAGVMIAFGSLLSMTAGGLCSSILGPAAKLVMAFSFAAALSFIVAGGGELFTGNNMVLGTGWFVRGISARACLSLWVLCWIGNLIGSWLAVLMFKAAGAISVECVANTIASVSAAKCSYSMTEMVVRGTLCNVLVCLAIWCSFRLKDETAKLVMVFWCIFAFMVCGFEHSIANMSIIGMALVGDVKIDFGWIDYAKNLYFVTIGNVIGGFFLVSIPYSIAEYLRVQSSK